MTKAVALALMLAAGSAMAQDLPDPIKTSGAVASTGEAEVCGYVGGLSYSKRHRHTTPQMKRQIRWMYGNRRCGEVDHLVPLALGGADETRNLWCQPGPDDAVWNYRVKDRLEAFVWASVCRAHRMTLAEGQAVFLRPDWRVEYCRLIGGAPCEVGGVGNDR